MLTPAFELSQDRDFLTVAIRVPHARASEFDVYFEGVDFKFYAKPYFLRRVPAACALRLLGNPRSRTHSRGSRPCLGGFSLAVSRAIASFLTCPSHHRARGHPPSVCPVTLGPSCLVLFSRCTPTPLPGAVTSPQGRPFDTRRHAFRVRLLADRFLLPAVLRFPLHQFNLFLPGCHERRVVVSTCPSGFFSVLNQNSSGSLHWGDL